MHVDAVDSAKLFYREQKEGVSRGRSLAGYVADVETARDCLVHARQGLEDFKAKNKRPTK